MDVNGLDGAATQVSVFLTDTEPKWEALKSKDTPKASNKLSKGMHFSPSSAKTQPSNLKSETMVASVLFDSAGLLKEMKSS